MQSATAVSLSAFMTLLAQNKLVNPSASASMRSYMDKNGDGRGSYSPLGYGLEDQNWAGKQLKEIYSKIGVMNGVDDVALIKRDEGRKQLYYVAVGLRAAQAEYLYELAAELDKCIQQNNGISP